MQKLPVVNGKQLIKFLTKLGYTVIRQKGSHVRLRNYTKIGEHNITVPLHGEISKGTLNDILEKVSLLKGIPKKPDRIAAVR